MKKKWPKTSELKRMEKILSKVEGTYVLPSGAGALERAKYEICRKVLVFMRDKGFSQRELASFMNIPETRISEIVHYRIDKFTLDKLVSYYQILNPKVKISVA